MKLSPALILLLAAAPGARAADYALESGAIRVHAPDAWPAIMQKTEGDPQFVVLQVANPQSPDTLARISVNVREVGSAVAFQDYVKTELSHAEHSAGYKEAPARKGDSATLRYTIDEDNERQVARLSFWHKGSHAVRLSCMRPEGAPASAQWLRDFEHGCDDLAAQLAK
jgi:hypothetical protein